MSLKVILIIPMCLLIYENTEVYSRKWGSMRNDRSPDLTDRVLFTSSNNSPPANLVAQGAMHFCSESLRYSGAEVDGGSCYAATFLYSIW